jgi:protein translocase SecG subunit
VKDLLEHLKNYWKVYMLFLVLTALCFLIGWLIGGPSTGLAWALTVDGSLMILIILLQQGRGGGLVGALGGMGAQSAFGARAGDAFTGITVVLTVLWVLLAGFGGITLRADRGNSTFDQLEVRLLTAISRWEGDGSMKLLVPIHLSATPSEDVEVSLRASVPASVQALHRVDLKDKPFTFKANTTDLRATVEIEYDGGTIPDGDWSFTVQIVKTSENAIRKLREASTLVTIMDDDVGTGLPELNAPGDPAGDSTDKDVEGPAVKKEPAEKKPAAKKPAEKKPAVKKKPAEKKPAAKKSGD